MEVFANAGKNSPKALMKKSYKRSNITIRAITLKSSINTINMTIWALPPVEKLTRVYKEFSTIRLYLALQIF